VNGNGGCVPSSAHVLEPANISGSLGEDLRKAVMRSAGTGLGQRQAVQGSLGCRWRRSFPSLLRPSLDWIRVFGGVRELVANLVVRAYGPHLSLYHVV
jgi:hypothetical protein